jgi:hypothetical protein
MPETNYFLAYMWTRARARLLNLLLTLILLMVYLPVCAGANSFDSAARSNDNNAAGSYSSTASNSSAGKDPERAPGVEWGPLLKQSALFLAIEHSYRMATEPGSRAALRGPFLRDYLESVRGLGGWSDGDDFLTNYIGHPIQGSVSGYLYVQNDRRARRLEFSKHGVYWRSRLKAMAFSAAYSTQFELGPISEASFGNLGGRTAPHAMSYVDLVVTPLGGMVWQVTEDALDKYVINWIERQTDVRVAQILVRGALNPTRSFANLLRGRVPWHRDSRPGVNEIATMREIQNQLTATRRAETSDEDEPVE